MVHVLFVQVYAKSNIVRASGPSRVARPLILRVEVIVNGDAAESRPIINDHLREGVIALAGVAGIWNVRLGAPQHWSGPSGCCCECWRVNPKRPSTRKAGVIVYVPANAVLVTSAVPSKPRLIGFGVAPKLPKLRSVSGSTLKRPLIASRLVAFQFTLLSTLW